MPNFHFQLFRHLLFTLMESPTTRSLIKAMEEIGQCTVCPWNGQTSLPCLSHDNYQKDKATHELEERENEPFPRYDGAAGGSKCFSTHRRGYSSTRKPMRTLVSSRITF